MASHLQSRTLKQCKMVMLLFLCICANITAQVKKWTLYLQLVFLGSEPRYLCSNPRHLTEHNIKPTPCKINVCSITNHVPGKTWNMSLQICLLLTPTSPVIHHLESSQMQQRAYFPTIQVPSVMKALFICLHRWPLKVQVHGNSIIITLS